MFRENDTIRPGLDIALIGMAGRFPGAEHIDEFWDNLKNGVESISFFSDEELEESGIDPENLKEPGYVSAKGVLENIEYFDASFFDYKPAEAEKLDPQMRVFHECTWKALENAGYNLETYKGLIGLYAGAVNNNIWQRLIVSRTDEASEIFAAAHLSDKDHISTRISYKLNLTGPSFTLETQCSTSLVAVHLACQGLLSGECDMALAGGVSITLPLKSGYKYQEGLISSPDGHCRAFDAKAQGTVFGNGAGVVVLKRIEEAVNDNDYIYAVVKGSAINNDGNRKVGYSAPSVEGQADAIKAAMQLSQVEPDTIGYIETHGTGTTLGDPIEIEALTNAFNTGKKGFCQLGSVKTNVGHLDNAAGIAGLIKTVLILKHQLIPPTLHVETPNPRIEFKNTPFYVNTKLVKWENNGNPYPLRAGLSSFGVGGTNAHVILEEAPIAQSAERKAHGAFGQGRGGVSPPGQSREYQLILLSAKTPSALDRMTKNLAAYFKNSLLNHGNHENPVNPGLTLADAAYTLQVGRKAFEHRLMLACSGINEAIAALQTSDPEKVRTFHAQKDAPQVVFMFPGQGAQYVDMGRELYRTEPVFQETMDQCFEILKLIMVDDIKEILYPGARKAQSAERKANKRHAPSAVRHEIDQTAITQPVIFAFEYALAKLLMKWGIKPDAMIGHSIGEYVAAQLSGVFSLEDALKLVVLRGKLMQQIPTGSMLSVQLTEQELKPLIKNNLSLAAVNARSLCVVSGPHDAIDSLAKQLKEKGCDSRRLHTSHAFHSPMMDPILTEFEEKLSKITLNKPGIPYISNISGKWLTPQDTTDPRYWAKHIRNTVRFSDGIQELLKENKPEPIFVEVGPGRVLSTFVRKHADKKTAPPVINLLRHPQENVSDIDFLLNKLGELWLYNKNIDWTGFYMEEQRLRIPLPTYSFERKRCWKYVDDFLKNKDKVSDISILKKRKDISKWFYLPSWKNSFLPLDNTDKTAAKSELPVWLVFMDECGIGAKLQEQLQGQGHEVFILKPGPGFSQVSDYEYTIKPGQDNDLKTLFQKLRELKKIPHKILHLWGITNQEDMELTFEKVDRAQEYGYYSLLSLAQAIGEQPAAGKNKFQILVVTNNMQEVAGDEEIIPGKATVLGPVKVIPKEYPGIICRSIDIHLPTPGTGEEERLLKQLLVETKAESVDTIIAYRGNHRLKQSYHRVELDEPEGTAQRIKKQGVYLVTGGLGGIGLVLAEYLARSVQAKLILTGRSSFPPRKEWEKWLLSHDQGDPISLKVLKLMELEKLGAKILVLCADTADLQQMTAVIDRAQEQLGSINGILHTAGVADYAGIIQKRTREMSENVFAPKVRGTIVLNRIFKNAQLDFFILFSSISSIIAPYGQVGYSAANAFLDAFSYYKTCIDSTFTQSINWDAWQEVGMAKDAAQKFWGRTGENGSNSMLKHAISTEEGIDVFNRTLDTPISRISVSTRNFVVMTEQIDSTGDEQSSPIIRSLDAIAPENLHQRPDISVEYIAPRDEIEQILSDTWKDFLGIQKVGIYDNFFDLGATSLDIVQVNEKIKKALKMEIPVVTMFEYPTISSLAQNFDLGESGNNRFDHRNYRVEEIQEGKKLLQQRLKKRGR